MNPAPRRMVTRVLATSAVALCLQLAVFVYAVPGVALRALALGMALGFFGLCARVLRTALRPLLLESQHAGWDPERAFGSPSLVRRDQTLRELERLRGELATRLEHSQRLRVRAEEARSYKTGFLKSVQHELRTPLNAILGFAEVLLSGIEGPLTLGQRENLGVIRTTGKRLHDLFDEVIELAATAAGEIEARTDPIELGHVLERIGTALQEERFDKPVHIRVDVADALPVLYGDEERIARLVRGIANHALGVLSGPLLVIAATRREDRIRISVRDPGRKLASQELSGLLGTQPIALRRKGLDEGSRLRIALWRQLADLLGGSLALTSGEHGTEFVLEWRAMRAA